MEGGSSINSIPSEARAKVDLRSESVERIEYMAALLGTSLDRAVEVENQRSPGGRVAGGLKEIGSRPGGGLAGGPPILERLGAGEWHLGIRRPLDCPPTHAHTSLS